ncbi:cellulase family glycosylhydrolase [Jeongeupia wiesaeckerbachi]|uniref:cellulase family glycosylhydrolase n=1 Tax=Jeongeupia wiesaeckerbachi TaxID=3051218 RepID=UPI003D802E05
MQQRFSKSRWLSRLNSQIVAAMLAVSVSAPAFAVLAGTAPTGGYITDSQGRALILHGLNTSSYSKNRADGMPQVTATDIAAENAGLGTNAVRLLIFWGLVEPAPGVYDDAYLANVATRVNWYQAAGMHVLLDMHQDLYGPAVTMQPGSVNGAPAWATYTDGLPYTPQSNFALGYLQPGEMRAWDNFWGTTGTHPELRTHYAAAWRHVAAYFAANDAIIGYDLMNEPWGGSLQSATFEPTVLLATYQAVINQIRSVDADRWIFVEPSAFPINQGLPTTLPKPSDPRVGGPRIVYAPHLYPPTLETYSATGSYTGLNVIPINLLLTTWTTLNTTTAALWNAPLAIGEFGAINYTAPGNTGYVDKIVGMADDIGASWFWWSNDHGATGPYQGNGVFNGLAPYLSRPYVQAVAGTPQRLDFDPASGRLLAQFANKAGVTGTTDFFLSPTVYPNGYTVTTTDPAGTWSASYDTARHVLSITADPASVNHSYTITPVP